MLGVITPDATDPIDGFPFYDDEWGTDLTTQNRTYPKLGI